MKRKAPKHKSKESTKNIEKRKNSDKPPAKKKIKQHELNADDILTASLNAKNKKSKYGPQRLKDSFFDLPAEELAKEILGKILVRRLEDGTILKGRIIETECYPGGEDKASISYNGRITEKCKAVYMKPGTTFVYMTYGIVPVYEYFQSRSTSSSSMQRGKEKKDWKRLLPMEDIRFSNTSISPLQLPDTFTSKYFSGMKLNHGNTSIVNVNKMKSKAVEVMQVSDTGIRSNKERKVIDRSPAKKGKSGELLNAEAILSSSLNIKNIKSNYGLKRLKDCFYDVSCKELAKGILGKILVRRLDDGTILKGRIVETECYLGGEDKASHSYNGRITERIKPMYMKPGTTYVYLTYGMYHCFNISSQGGLLNSPQGMMGAPPLQPMSGQPQQPTIMSSNEQQKQQVGSTWTNSGSLNIDVDNLSISGFRGSSKSGTSAPSMNHLAVSSPTSPLHPQPTNNRLQGMSPGVNIMGVAPSWPVQNNMMGMQQQNPQPQNQAFFPAFK